MKFLAFAAFLHERLLSFLPENRYTLLARAEGDTRFQERFFLLALCGTKGES
jgi:hypothetical protein